MKNDIPLPRVDHEEGPLIPNIEGILGLENSIYSQLFGRILRTGKGVQGMYICILISFDIIDFQSFILTTILFMGHMNKHQVDSFRLYSLFYTIHPFLGHCRREE